MPDSIFKLTNEDEEGTLKLKQFIKEIIKPSSAVVPLQNLRMSESASGFG